MKKIFLAFLIFQAPLLYAQDESALEEEFQNYFIPDEAPTLQLSRNIDFVRYRQRGYDNRYTQDQNYIDLSSGNIYWNAMSSLNKMKRYSRNMLSYSSTDRNYAHRIFCGTHVGRDVLLQLDRKWGENGFVSGLKSDITTASASFQKNFGIHIITAAYSGNWGSQGVRSAVTQEVYDLSSNIYYNPNTGIQNGKIRNSKTRGFNQNFGQVGYRVNPNKNLIINAEASIFVATNSFGLLSWYDAPTPYPDYYRSLPDFIGNPTVSDYVRDCWARDDKQVTQIDWQKIYEVNLFNNNDGRSQYILKDLVTQSNNLTFNAGLSYKSSPEFTINAFVKGANYASSNFARLTDLLGGSYWVDIDQYLLDDEYYGDKIQNNVREPNRKIIKGDKFEYNYNILTSNYKAGTSIMYNPKSWIINASLSVGRTAHTRDGKYEKESFAGEKSLGKSRTINFTEYDLRGTITRRFINLRHRVTGSFMLENVAPFVSNVFVSPEYRNQTVLNPQSIVVMGVELGYNYVLPHFVFGARGYATQFSNDNYITSYFDDLAGEYANLIMTGVDKLNYGIETEAEFHPTTKLTIKCMAAYNVYKYASNPRIDILQDKDAQPIVTNSKSFLKGYRLPGTPQSFGVVEARYRFPSYYYLGASVNYAGDNFCAVNPVRRMARVTDLADSPELKAATIVQESFGNAVTVNLSLSKEFRLNNGDRIGFWGTINNLLNDRSIKYGGYEQMRFSRSDAASGRNLIPFKSKFYYAYGTNYYATISYIF